MKSMLPIPKSRATSQECVGGRADQEPTIENMTTRQQLERAPIEMVQGNAWSPGVYCALCILGCSLDVALAWEKAFISHF
jgi:hypothetical protein